MGLEKIIAISGKPGLYELVSQTRAGFIVTSLADGKRQSISMRNNVSVLNEISIYTYGEEIPLGTVLATIAENTNKQATISHKSSKKELENFFREVLPEYDEDRVYTSDIKKIVQWYNLLQKANLVDDLDKTDDGEGEVDAETETEIEEETVTKEVKKTKPKKEAGKVKKETSTKKAAPKKK